MNHPIFIKQALFTCLVVFFMASILFLPLSSSASMGDEVAINQTASLLGGIQNLLHGAAHLSSGTIATLSNVLHGISGLLNPTQIIATITPSAKAATNTIGFVQGAATDCGVVASCTLSWPSANTSSNLLVLALRVGNKNQAITITDTNGNTYTQAATQINNADGQQSYVFYAPNAIAGSNTVTVSVAGTLGTIRFALNEYSGIQYSSPVDVTSTAEGPNGSNTINTGSATTTNAADLVFALGTTGDDNAITVTAGNGFTLRAATNKVATGDAILSNTQSINATFSLAHPDNWAGILVAFKGANGATPPPPPPLPTPDTTSPIISLTAPTANTMVSGATTVSATASDNIGVSGVQFKLDGNNLSFEDTSSPYSISWDTMAVSNANHTLTAVVRDAAGNTTTSSAITVTVHNMVMPPPPSGSQPASFVTMSDTIPNFAKNFTIQSAQSGSWSSPATWNPARVPISTDVVLINHTVTYDSLTGNADTVGIGTGGNLHFSTSQNTSFKVANLLVQPQGTLEVGTQSNPIPANITAEIVVKNKALDLVNDVNQFGTGIISIDGTVSMYGAVKSPTFIRTAIEPKAGNSTLTLEQPATGWRVGDKIFVPDTRQVDQNNQFNANYVLQIEQRTIQAISANGLTITLSSPLTYNHFGAKDADGTLTIYNGIKYLPHIGNLTRNILIRSENPSGTRGHTLLTGRSNVHIDYVQVQDMGRTKAEPLNGVSNHIGRYPLHAHHLTGPVNSSNTGYQFEFVGNAIADSLKWPMAIHSSHYGLIQQNVVFGGSQLTGAGIAVEDGSETENLFDSNFVAYIQGTTNPRNSGPDTADGSTPGSAAECYWAAGFNNRFVNNVASDCRNPSQQIVSGPGWKLITNAAPFTTRNPLFRGADMMNASQTIAVVPQRQAVLEFRGNEVYGITATGLTMWQLGTDGGNVISMPETLIKDFRVWNTYFGAIWNYPTNHVTIEGLVYRVDPDVLYCCTYRPSAIESGDYRTINLTIRGGSIHAGAVFDLTTDPVGTILIENVNAITSGLAFTFEAPWTPGARTTPTGTGITATLKNNVVSAWPGQSLRTILMYFRNGEGAFLNERFDVYAYDYQGQAGNNFKIFWNEQATQNIAGGLAPCNDTTTHPEISGITCPITGTLPSSFDTTPPTVSLTTPSSGATVSGTAVAVSATAFDAVGVSGVQFKIDGVNLQAEDTTSPYSITWDTTTATNGSHTLTATARDAAGNTTTSQSVTITTNNTVVTLSAITKFVIGDRVQTTGTLNVRFTPSTSGTILGTQVIGSQGTIIGGSITANGFNWWSINYDNGVDGWSAEDFLAKATASSVTVPVSDTIPPNPTPTPTTPMAPTTPTTPTTPTAPTTPTTPTIPPNPVSTPTTGKFNLGDRVTVIGLGLNVRNQQGDKIGFQPKNAQGTIVGGPIPKNGYIYWDIHYDVPVHDGRSIENWLQITTATNLTRTQKMEYIKSQIQILQAALAELIKLEATP